MPPKRAVLAPLKPAEPRKEEMTSLIAELNGGGVNRPGVLEPISNNKMPDSPDPQP